MPKGGKSPYCSECRAFRNQFQKLEDMFGEYEKEAKGSALDRCRDLLDEFDDDGEDSVEENSRLEA